MHLGAILSGKKRYRFVASPAIIVNRYTKQAMNRRSYSITA